MSADGGSSSVAATASEDPAPVGAPSASDAGRAASGPATAPAPFHVRSPVFEGSLGELTQALRTGTVAPERLDLLSLVRDFLDHFGSFADDDLERASEALPSIAQVIELKLRLMLPRPPRDADEEGEEGVEGLSEALDAVALLEAMEDAIRFLRARRHERRLVLPATAPRPDLPRPARPHRVGIGRLAELAARARPGGYFEVSGDRLTLAQAMRTLLRNLRAAGRGLLARLHPAGSWAEQTVVFAAMLELVREGRAEADQEEPYGPIEVRDARR